MQKQSSKAIADKNLKKIITLCYEMLELADHGDKFRRDDGCGVVYGSLRDVAYKIRQMAEQELSRHGDNRNRLSEKAD